MQLNIPRLDILLYAHDGRGLGHVSRSVAIGMAVRRLYPDLKVCLVTGCRQTQELIGSAPLDWLKLPAYETEVVDGASRGIDGMSGYADKTLGRMRADHIRHICTQYRPRLVLADHSPQGKHRELVPSLELPGLQDSTKWLLGMRGIVGGVVQTQSPLARDLFQRHYSKLLWYGDSTVLGQEHCDRLGDTFGTTVLECGYVSRMTEVQRISPGPPAEMKKYGCTISIPWLGEHTQPLLEALVKAIPRLGPSFGCFRFFLGDDTPPSLRKRLFDLDHCTVEPFGSNYSYSLAISKSALIFGGYNSLVDVLTADIPALVVMRDMKDREQQLHLEALVRAAPKSLRVVSERNCDEIVLHDNLTTLLADDGTDSAMAHINLKGAETSAHLLAATL